MPVIVSVAGGELARLDDIGYGLQRGAFSRWTVKQALQGADRVIVACSYAQRLINRLPYPVPAEKIRTIALGVDTNTYQKTGETSYSSSSQKSRLIHVASLVGVKDQATLLRALARLDTDISLDIIGTGPQQDSLQTLAKQLGITEQVNFIGGVDHLELPHHYQQAALNVLSSRHEGLGMVTLEAAACGIATVSTAVGLLPDHSALGVSVPVGDDAALAAAIDGLLADDQRRTSLAQSAYETAQAQFTIQHSAENFRRLYADLIKTNPNPEEVQKFISQYVKEPDVLVAQIFSDFKRLYIGEEKQTN